MISATVRWLAAALLPMLLLSGCAPPVTPGAAPLPPLAAGGLAQAPRRINGTIGSPNAMPPPQISYGAAPAAVPPAVREHNGAYSLDLADVDVREAVAQILGGILRINYAIDPAVHGTVTLHTVRPLPRDDLLPALETLLAQAGATLVKADGLYRVVPEASAPAAGARVLPLHFASAENLAKLLQPIVGSGARIVADTAQNALLVAGQPGQVDSVEQMVQAFDVDALAGQSYALLSVPSGTAKDFADALQVAFRARSEGGLAGLVRVLPLARMNAVLLVSAQPRYIDAARRVYALVERARRQTTRSWQVYYLQNGNADDTAYVLQQAFTPNNVTAQPSSVTHPQHQGIGQGLAAGMGGGIGGAMQGGSMQGGAMQGGMAGGMAASPLGMAGAGGMAQGGNPLPAPATGGAAVNPLLGGLDQSGGGSDAEAMRILPDAQNNAILIYGTPRENDTVLAMLHKTDILPLQVRIDAVIAEVTLNDALQYGTQFFFKGNGLNVLLNSTVPTAAAIGSGSVGSFVISGQGAGGAPAALSMLQAVTTVHVLSSPELLVLDNQTARLQVGDLVPYLTATSTSTLTNTAQIVNSVNYQPTGVILEVTPRVNSSGLVTLDVSQEVSDIDTTVTAATTGINSPAFLERSVTSRVVVQDGQTVGIAGLIRDNITKSNQGIPFLKDVPLLGALFSNQSNSRARTELLVLITPHVIRDQRDARALTEDLREALPNAAAVPYLSRHEPLSGSADPNAPMIDRARNALEH